MNNNNSAVTMTPEVADTIREAVAKAKGGLVILTQALPWEVAIVITAPQIRFVIQPGKDEEWLIRAVPRELGEKRLMRQPLPFRWRGLGGEALADETGVRDAKFCDNFGTYAVASSETGALELARQIFHG